MIVSDSDIRRQAERQTRHSDDLLVSRLAQIGRGHKHGGSEASWQDECEPAEETAGSFGWVRGFNARAIMLELRQRDGSVIGIGYAWIERIDYDPSAGITIYCGGIGIRIQGRNLNAEVRPGLSLFSSLIRHRAVWIAESDRVHDLTPHGLPVIEKIVI